MNTNYKKTIKVIVIICIFVLIFDLIILLRNKSKAEEKAYFDGINSIEVVDNSIIAVGSNSDNKKGYEKAKITLYNTKYEKIWETLFNKKYNSSFSSVAKDEDKYIAVGNYEASKEEHKNSTRSGLIAIYDIDGKLISQKRFQVLGNSKFTDIKVVEDGYIVIGQSIYENNTLGVSDKGGAFIIKYDKNLNEVWKKNYGGSKSGIYNDMIILNNYIYVVGKDLSRLGIISKYSMDGNHIKTNTYKYTDTFGFTGLATDNNNLYVVGSKKVKEDENSYDTDSIVIKYDLELNQQKEQIYRGKGMERYNKIIVDDKNNIVIAGQTGVYDKEKSTKELNVFAYDGIFAKYNSDLEELLVENYGDEENDYFTDINKVNNKYIISGYKTNKNNYISKFITYTTSGKVIEDK